MSNIVPINGAQAPALLRQRLQQGQSVAKNFSDGVRDGFPILSIKGKVFRARINGQEQALIDPTTRTPVGFLDVVLVNAGRHLSKAYYVSGYTEGDNEAPDCWSLDSIRPDASVANKVNLTCANCPMNQFGSRTSNEGKAAKACSDARRVAIAMPHHLADAEPLLFLLRIAQSSLKNLKNYAEMLAKHGFDPNACITRLAFDFNEAYPKLLFNFVAPLTDAQYQKTLELAEAPTTNQMLMAPDFDQAASTTPKQDDGSQHNGVGGLAPQTAPVMDAGAAQATQPAQAQTTTVQKPAAETAASTQTINPGLIQLPDGRFYDPVSQQYVEPQVQERELDPTTIKLPDGQFFNTATQQFVSGPYKGDAPAQAAAPKTTRTRKAKEEKKPEPDTQASSTASQQVVESSQDETAAATAEDNDAVKPGVSAAPPGLDALLNTLMPPNGQ